MDGRADTDEQDGETLEVVLPEPSGRWIVEAGARAIPSVQHVDEGAPVVIGTDASCTIRVFDRTVSHRHCRVTAERGLLLVEDLGSRNGIFVGGGRVRTAELLPGANLVVGRMVIACRNARPTGQKDRDAEPPTLPGVIGASAVMRDLARDLGRLAIVKAPVLFQGETGSGKDVIARALHAMGPRKRRPFVALNVGTLPRELADAELFGHERGAFTGAHVAREGAFVEADGGTLFLDEVADLVPDLQVKLLRVLEDGEVRPIGGRARRRVDVRIMSACWAPLESRVAEGSFRQDLFQRLAVCVVNVPPLRDRGSDLPELARHLLDSLREDVGRCEVAPAALAKLAAHPFPGNVRELKNVLYRAALRCSGGVIGPDDVAISLANPAPSFARPVPLTRDQARALVTTLGGNVSAAARQAGVARSTFRDWMR
jgi:DNA-binding NtrC family response regulator